MLDKKITVNLPGSFELSFVRLISYFVLFAALLYVYFTGFGDRHYLACAPTQRSIQKTISNSTSFFIRDRSGGWLTLIRMRDEFYELKADIIRSDELYNLYIPSIKFTLPFNERKDPAFDPGTLDLIRSISGLYISMRAEEDEFEIDISSKTSNLVIDKQTLVAKEFFDKENSERFLSAQCVAISETTFNLLESQLYKRRLEESFYAIRKSLSSSIRDHEEDQSEKFKVIRDYKNLIK